MGWICAKGHRWLQSPNNRSRGVGCPECADYGYSCVKEGWLYLLEQTDLGMLQIGISNVPDQRLGQHARRGWKPLEVLGPMPGSDAHSLEQMLLKALRDRGVLRGSTQAAGKFDGYSESWMAADLPIRSIDALVALVGVGLGELA